MRLEVHVRPNAPRTVVGGTHDEALVVRVKEPAEHGRATEATLRAIADALAVPRRSVSLVLGTTSRRKVIEVAVTGPEAGPLERRLEALRTSGR